jgi:release factor glutamine methyltransferase
MGVKIQTIKDIRFYLTKELKTVYKDPEIRSLADLLIKSVMQITKLHQLYDNGYPVTDEEERKIIEIIRELKTGKPVQYILGETTFYNCTIRVNSSTLIPRPETEELVDLIIRENRDFRGSILDLGTGSGCIAIALAANLPFTRVKGIDISDDAISIARQNAFLNKVDVSFVKGDIFSLDQEDAGGAGIIVSNPPYVRESEKLIMGKNVIDFEPHQALFVTDSEPLIYYHAILSIAHIVLLPGGLLYLEINEEMGKPLIRLLESYSYSEIKIVLDINNKERIIKGRKNV